MRNEGGDVPMELIAERAGLTRGTPYRNFPPRQAVYEAVIEHDLEAMTRVLAAVSALDDCDLQKNQTHMVAAVGAPLRRAQSLGVVRTDLTATTFSWPAECSPRTGSSMVRPSTHL